jgi:hypothetical protein
VDNYFLIIGAEVKATTNLWITLAAGQSPLPRVAPSASTLLSSLPSLENLDEKLTSTPD